MKTICVYCGSSDKIGDEYLLAAHRMGAAIAERGYSLVYGAGCTGLMGAVADGALEARGEVIGVIPRLFATPALMHTGLTRLEIVDSMHTRKQRMVNISDAFIALPGGYGTFEELFEVLTWAQIGMHSKPIGILNVRSYYDPLLLTIDHACKEGFIYEEHGSFLVCSDQPKELLIKLESYQFPTGLEKWLTREE
jgi:uncharacterized protein (TIGR00730 family)